MPVFNSRAYIAHAVESILSQTLRDFEFIIIDDGSTDGSSRILDAYARHDARIVLVRQANGGVAAASNRGVSLARGEFIARMDHDDIAMPDRFQRQVDYLRDNPDCVAVGGQVLMIDSEGLPLRVYSVPQSHEQIEAALGRHWAMFHPTMMARSEVVRAVGGYSVRFSNMEDLDLFFKLAERGRLANLPDILLQYRQHFSSICHTKGLEEHQRLRQQIMAEVSQRRGREVAPLPKTPAAPERRQPSRRELHWSYEKMWAWWALDSSHVQSARRHALRALKTGPHRLETWVLLWCVLRGYLAKHRTDTSQPANRQDAEAAA